MMLNKVKQLLDRHERLVIEANEEEWVSVFNYFKAFHNKGEWCKCFPCYMVVMYEGIEVTILRLSEYKHIEGKKLRIRPTGAVVTKKSKDSFALEYLLNPLRSEVLYL